MTVYPSSTHLILSYPIPSRTSPLPCLASRLKRDTMSMYAKCLCFRPITHRPSWLCMCLLFIFYFLLTKREKKRQGFIQKGDPGIEHGARYFFNFSCPLFLRVCSKREKRKVPWRWYRNNSVLSWIMVLLFLPSALSHLSPAALSNRVQFALFISQTHF